MQEFISICEALELVPEDELDASRQGAANTFATRRAKKVYYSLPKELLNSHLHVFMR